MATLKEVDNLQSHFDLGGSLTYGAHMAILRCSDEVKDYLCSVPGAGEIGLSADGKLRPEAITASVMSAIEAMKAAEQEESAAQQLSA